MGLFSGLTKSDGFEYENVGSAHKNEPPLVTATPIATASSSLPTVAEAINISKLAAAGASTAAASTAAAVAGATNNAFSSNNNNNSSAVQLPLTSGRFPTPLSTNCPHCHTPQIITRVRTYPTFETWAMIVLLFLVFWPVCWIPLVIDTCKTTDHFCTNCNENVGRVKPLSDCCVTERG